MTNDTCALSSNKEDVMDLYHYFLLGIWTLIFWLSRPTFKEVIWNEPEESGNARLLSIMSAALLSVATAMPAAMVASDLTDWGYWGSPLQALLIWLLNGIALMAMGFLSTLYELVVEQEREDELQNKYS